MSRERTRESVLEKENKNRLKQIRGKNKELKLMKERFEKSEATEEDIQKVFNDLEGYFSGAQMPSLNLYTGDYSGEILNYAFENYPDVFVKERYERMSKKSFKRMLAESYSVVLGKIADGKIRQSQLLDFLKYIEPYLNKKEEEEVETSKIEMIFKHS